MSEISLSIEETNKLRIKMGLKPLSEDTGDKKKKDAEDNYLEFKEESEKQSKENEIKEAIRKSKNKLDLNRKLAGKGLGEKNEADDSTLGWILKNRGKLKNKPQVKVDYDELDKEFQSESKQKAKTGYTVPDLKVAHDLEDFQQGEEAVLTLKDSNVLDEDEDELVNINMQEIERIQYNLENKNKKSNYNPYDDEEFGLGTESFKPKKILSHYDEEEDTNAIKKKGFKIGSISNQKISNFKNLFEENDKAVSLDFDHLNEVKDYYTKEEASSMFKKPKKSKNRKKSLRKKNNVEDNGAEPEALDVAEPKKDYIAPADSNFVDDDELQLALSKARTIAVKTKVKTDEEELAKQILQNNNSIEEKDIDDSNGLVISNTSEFVQNLAEASAAQAEKIQRNYQRQEAQEKAKVESKKKAEIIEDAAASPIVESNKSEEEGGVDTLFDSEVKVRSGLAGALEYFAKKGMYKPPTEEEIRRDKLLSEQNQWIMKQKNDDKRKSRRAEESNSRSKQFAEESQARLKDYKPDIKIEYRDAEGNLLDKKEAFRNLSHKFHGKTSGLKKTEKRMAKLEQAKKLEFGGTESTNPSDTKRFKSKKY